MTPQGSRLNRNLEKQTKKQIITYLVIIGIIVFVLFTFGGTIIGTLGDIIFGIKGNQEQTQQIQSKEHLEAPNIDTLPAGTDQDNVDVTGSTSVKDSTITLYVNDTIYKNIEVDSDGKFKKNIHLSVGENTIKAKVKKNDNESDFSDEEKIMYSKDAPALDVSSPSDNQTFTKADQEINVTGKTDSGDITVTVNDFRAIVQDDGSFSYYAKLNDGDNTLKVKATNSAGKSTEKEIHVKYQP